MSTTSFLPEDYLDQKAERRTNVISLTLFGIVMISVFAAFLVTNRQWTKVKEARLDINEQYRQFADQIETLNELERQKNAMLSKARLAAALVERVPRSILLAELINRMPDRLGLLLFELDSAKIRAPRKKLERPGTRRLRGPARAMTREEAIAAAQEEDEEVEVPQYLVSLRLVGLAPTDVEVASYMSELNAHPLLEDVSLEYSKERKYDGAKMREFEINMKLNGKLDVRDVAPLIKRKGGADPSRTNLITPGSTVSANPSGRGG